MARAEAGAIQQANAFPEIYGHCMKGYAHICHRLWSKKIYATYMQDHYEISDNSEEHY